MSDGRKEMRKLLDMLGEKNHNIMSNKPTVLKEHGYPDIDDPDTGRETKVEVEFKDGDQIEVEVYAQGVDQLKRLMDLAGIFHQDKQSGSLSHGEPVPVTGPESEPVEPAPMDSGMVGVEPGVDNGLGMDSGPPLDAEPDMDVGMPEVPGTDIVAAPGNDLDGDESPELDFDMGMESEENDEDGLEETNGQRWDYGHPNPMLGQEPYEPEASNYSGLAGKPNRYVQAKHGDNAMVDVSRLKKGDAFDELDETNTSKKSLGDYLEEVSQEKKDLDEVDPTKVGELIARTTPKNISGPKLKAISTAGERLERDIASGKQKVNSLNPEQVMDLVTSDDPVQATGFAQPDKKKVTDLIDQFGDEFDEKRQYSFKQQNLPFQGLTGMQRVRRNALRAVRRNLRK